MNCMDRFWRQDKHECPKQDVTIKNPFEGKVKCNECAHWIDETDAQKVSVDASYNSYVRTYCPLHRRAYSRMSVYGMSVIYFAEVSVSEDGTPIGYKKLGKGKLHPTTTQENRDNEWQRKIQSFKQFVDEERVTKEKALENQRDETVKIVEAKMEEIGNTTVDLCKNSQEFKNDVLAALEEIIAKIKQEI